MNSWFYVLNSLNFFITKKLILAFDIEYVSGNHFFYGFLETALRQNKDQKSRLPAKLEIFQLISQTRALNLSIH